MDDVSRVSDLTRQLARALEDHAVLYAERELLLEECQLLQEQNRELKAKMGLQEPMLHD